jgi:hypothetical protein
MHPLCCSIKQDVKINILLSVRYMTDIPLSQFSSISIFSLGFIFLYVVISRLSHLLPCVKIPIPLFLDIEFVTHIECKY